MRVLSWLFDHVYRKDVFHSIKEKKSEKSQQRNKTYIQGKSQRQKTN